MVQSREERRAARAEYERNFRATHGVSTGTYYRQRRIAESVGINPRAFDKIVARKGFETAKEFRHDFVKESDRINEGRPDGILQKEWNQLRQQAVTDYYDDYFPDIEFEPGDYWYH